MEDNIDVLGVELNCLTAKEAMLQAMQFMENDLVDTIEILSMEDLMYGREDVEWKNLVREFGLVLPGEAEILKAADVHDRAKEKETANHTFLKLFLKCEFFVKILRKCIKIMYFLFLFLMFCINILHEYVNGRNYLGLKFVKNVHGIM